MERLVTNAFYKRTCPEKVIGTGLVEGGSSDEGVIGRGRYPPPTPRFLATPADSPNLGDRLNLFAPIS